MKYTKVLTQSEGRAIYYVLLHPLDTGMFPAGLALADKFAERDRAEKFAQKVDSYIDRLITLRAEGNLPPVKVLVQSRDEGGLVFYVRLPTVESVALTTGFSFADQFYDKDRAEPFAAKVEAYIEKLITLRVARLLQRA